MPGSDSGSAPLLIVTDAPPATGIGAYTDRLVRLLRPAIPQVRRVSLYPSATQTDNDLVIPGLVRAVSRLDVPSARVRNRQALREFLRTHEAFLHLTGSNYALVDVGTPTVCTVHDFYFRVPSPSVWRNPPELAAEVLINLNLLRSAQYLRRAAAIVCPSEWTRVEVERAAGLRSTVIHHWVEASRFYPRSAERSRALLGLSPTGRYLLNVGGAGSNKNIPLLARIASRLPGGWSLLKIGQPIHSRNCTDLLNVAPEVYPLYFNACDGYLHTSVREGFGIPLIESMGSGTPVILPRTSTGPEIVGGAGLYPHHESQPSEYVAMARSLEDPTIRERQRAAVLDRSRLFSEDGARAAYLDFYRRAVGLTT